MSPAQIVIASACLGLIAAAIAAVVFSANAGVVRYEQPYPPDCPVGGQCRVELRPDRDLTGPVYFHYKIDGMYQNHRRYVKSRSGAQLRGEPGAETRSCRPLERDADDRILYPCGLIAASKFSDRIQLRIDGALQTGLAWDSEPIRTPHDRDYYRLSDQYRNASRFSSGLGAGLYGRPVQLSNVTDPDFAVWMRPAALPAFSKLYRVRHVAEPIRAGARLEFTIDNEFDAGAFDGRKSLTMTTMSFLGGRQTFLAWAWAVLALACLAFAVVVYFTGVRTTPSNGSEQRRADDAA